jgi:hypothetical protein
MLFGEAPNIHIIVPKKELCPICTSINLNSNIDPSWWEFIALAKLLEKNLLLKGQWRSSLPLEVIHLLKVMKTDAVALFPLI